MQPELFLVAVDRGEELDTGDGEAAGVGDGIGAQAPGELVGTVMAGYDGHRGWLYYLAVAGVARRRGVATALIAEAERLLEARGCPKVMLMVRRDNAAVATMYEGLGYDEDEVLVLGKRLISDL